MSIYYDNCIQYLNSKFNIMTIPLNEIPNFSLSLKKINALNLPLNTQKYLLGKAELELHFLKIEKNEYSKIYFSESFSDFTPLYLNDDFSEDILFVILDHTLGVLESNSNFLFVDIVVNQGLHENDLKIDGIKEYYMYYKKVLQQYISL